MGTARSSRGWVGDPFKGTTDGSISAPPPTIRTDRLLFRPPQRAAGSKGVFNSTRADLRGPSALTRLASRRTVFRGEPGSERCVECCSVEPDSTPTVIHAGCLPEFQVLAGAYCCGEGFVGEDDVEETRGRRDLANEFRRTPKV